MRWDGDYLTVWNQQQAEQGLQAKTIRSLAWNKEINVTVKNELSAHAPVWIVWVDYNGDVALTHQQKLSAGSSWSSKTFETHPFAIYSKENCSGLLAVWSVENAPPAQGCGKNVHIDLVIRGTQNGITIEPLCSVLQPIAQAT